MSGKEEPQSLLKAGIVSINLNAQAVNEKMPMAIGLAIVGE